MKYVFEHEEIEDCGYCPFLFIKRCAITGQRILTAGELANVEVDPEPEDTRFYRKCRWMADRGWKPYTFVAPEVECPLKDFDVEKRLYLIKFLEGVRSHILSKEWVEEIDLEFLSYKVRHTFAIDERNLKDIIGGIRERMEEEPE